MTDDDISEDVLTVLDWIEGMTDQGHDLDRLLQAMMEAIKTIAQADGVAGNLH